MLPGDEVNEVTAAVNTNVIHAPPQSGPPLRAPLLRSAFHTQNYYFIFWFYAFLLLFCAMYHARGG